MIEDSRENDQNYGANRGGIELRKCPKLIVGNGRVDGGDEWRMNGDEWRIDRGWMNGEMNRGPTEERIK
jgi:hypothetical protein